MYYYVPVIRGSSVNRYEKSNELPIGSKRRFSLKSNNVTRVFVSDNTTVNFHEKNLSYTLPYVHSRRTHDLLYIPGGASVYDPVVSTSSARYRNKTKFVIERRKSIM